uniref:Phosphoinositide phospholipase C n=1 Tax=Setaria digitata TaxID=48799 RepID=A0A915PW44_9BILA
MEAEREIRKGNTENQKAVQANVQAVSEEETPSTASHFSRKSSPLRSSLMKRENRNRSSSTKFVSFSTQNHEKKICNVSDCIEMMQNATEFIKLRTNIRQFRRTFALDSDLSHIYWTPTNKKPHKAKIAIESIKEIRIGRNTELHRATETYINDMQEECAFSIIHGDRYECLDLIAKTPEIAKIWTTGLTSLISNHAEILKLTFSTLTGICESQPSGSQPLATLRERWLGSVFDEMDIENIGCLSENQTVELIKQLNSRISRSAIQHKVKEACILNPEESKRGKVTRSQFIEIYKDVATRSEIYFLMVRYANKDYLSCKDLQVFLETEQGFLGVTMNFCEKIIEEYEPCQEARELNHMTVDGFTNYLLNDENSLFDSAHKNVCQKMNEPFSNYFIASSHNTSLIEDQLKEPADCAGYVAALRRNCRFIEVDVWEPVAGSNKKELIVHNRYGSSKLTLSAVLNVINEMAFENTRYPLFMQLEIHLNVEWQLTLVDILSDIFGNKLYNPKTDPVDWIQESRQPTPKDFQMKIILTCGPIEGTEDEISEGTLDDENGSAQSDETTDSASSKCAKKMNLCRKLSDLMCPWAVPAVFNEDSFTDNVNKTYHLLSISECNCLKMVHNLPSEFAQTAKNCLIRVTPNSTRIDSSNLNPQEFWNFGIQMVSLNYQTLGLTMDLQQGKFSENGGCGYVLKPSIMRDELYTPGDIIPFPPQILYLRILSGQQLPRPRGSTAKGDSMDPYVVVEVFGFPNDCAEERTRTVKNDSSNPSFDESFQFQITVPEMALIRFLVLDDDFIDDDFIGQYTIPFECLKNGYRHVPLLNSEGEILENCTLFVHVAVTNRYGGGIVPTMMLSD